MNNFIIFKFYWAFWFFWYRRVFWLFRRF